MSLPSTDDIPFKVALGAQEKLLEHSLLHIFVRLCETSLQLPRALQLPNVRLSDRQPIDGGSYGDIYRGEFKGKSVAIKSLRIFKRRECEDDTTKKRKVTQAC